MGLVMLAHFEAALRKAAKEEADWLSIGGLAVAAWSQSLHLGLLARFIPQFVREARERGLAAEVVERCGVLDGILETWRVPFSAAELSEFRMVLRDGAR